MRFLACMIFGLLLATGCIKAHAAELQMPLQVIACESAGQHMKHGRLNCNRLTSSYYSSGQWSMAKIDIGPAIGCMRADGELLPAKRRRLGKIVW